MVGRGHIEQTATACAEKTKGAEQRAIPKARRKANRASPGSAGGAGHEAEQDKILKSRPNSTRAKGPKRPNRKSGENSPIRATLSTRNTDFEVDFSTRPFDSVSQGEYDLISAHWDEIMATAYRCLNQEE